MEAVEGGKRGTRARGSGADGGLSSCLLSLLCIQKNLFSFLCVCFEREKRGRSGPRRKIRRQTACFVLFGPHHLATSSQSVSFTCAKRKKRGENGLETAREEGGRWRKTKRQSRKQKKASTNSKPTKKASKQEKRELHEWLLARKTGASPSFLSFVSFHCALPVVVFTHCCFYTNSPPNDPFPTHNAKGKAKHTQSKKEAGKGGRAEKPVWWLWRWVVCL